MGFALVDHSRRYLLSKWADRLSASISRELARGNRCEVELAGPVSSPAHPPPPVNARTLLTHVAGSGPAHWSADGYLSAVARTGPDVVWPLEEGGQPATCIGTGAQRFVATDAAVADVGARQAFSIAGWCHIADAASDPDVEIVRKLSGQGAQASGYRLSYARATAALTVAVAHAGATGPSGSWTAAATLVDGRWHHYAVVYGSDALDVWVDGVRVLRQTAGIGFDRSLAATSGLALGDAQMTTGIDDWAFWRRKLTDTEIRNLYAAWLGRSGFDFRALLASGRPRGVVSFDTGTVAPAIGTADLPAGMAAALPAANLPLPAVGSRSAGVPYSWAAWLRVDWIPRSAYDVRLAKNDGAVTVGVATPVRGRSRGNASGALTDDGLRFAAEVVVTYRGGATSRWQKVDVTAAGVLRFESTAAVPAAEKAAYALVLVRLDDDGAAAFTRVRDLAATTWAGGVTQWPADTRLRDDVTGQSFVGSWSVLVVDHDVAHFDAHTLVWQPEETAPVPIWRRGGAAGQSMEVQYRPRASEGRHRHALRIGSLPVPSRSSPVRYARDGVAFALGASGVTLLTGGSSDVILGSAAGRDPVAITRITAAADALTIDLGGGLHAGDAGHYAFLAVNARDGATFVFRFSADTSSPPSSDPYEIPRRGVGSALRAASHLANRWRLLVVDTSFAGLDTTDWTWLDGGAPHTFAVRLTGPSVDGVTEAFEAEAGVQDDGEWHRVAWSLTEDGLSLWLDRAQMSPVPVRLAGSIWTGAQPVGEDDATRLLALGVSAPGDGTFAGRNGAFVLEPANAAETLALPDTDGPSRYVHRLHVSFTSDTVTTVYIGLALLRTAGAENARANLSSEAFTAYRVYVRVRRAGMRDAVLSADLSADANIATPYVVAADTPDDFSFRSRAGAVFDVAIVDKRPKFGFDETAETVPGAGLDLHEVDYDVTTTLTRVPFHASNAPAAASASPLRAVFRATASVAGNGDVTLTPNAGVSTTLHLPDGTTRSMDLSGVEVSSRRLRLTLRGNSVASAAVRNYRLVLSRVPGVGGSRTFRVWDFAAAVRQVNRFDWTVSDFNALIGEFTAGAQVDVAVFDTAYRRDRADGYVDDWTAPKVETAAVGDGVLVGRARSVGAIDELADWTRAVDSREWTAQVDTRPVERVFGGLLAAPEQRRAEDGRRRVSLRLRSFAAQLEEVRAGGLELADGLFLAALPVSGAAGVLQRLWQDWLAARPVEVAQGGTVTQQPLSVTPDRVAPAVGALTFGPAVVEHLSFAGILDRIAEEHNLSWAVDDYGALTMTRSRDVRAAAVLDEAGGVERAPRLVWDRRHLRTRQTVLGAPVEGRIVETFTGTAHTVTITEPRLTLRQGTGAADSRDDGRRLDGARRVFAAHPYVVKVTGVEVRRGPSGSPVRQFGEGYTGSRRWFWDPGATHRLTQAAGEPVLQAADTLTIRGVTSREPKESSTSRTAGVYGIIEAVERDPSLRADLVAPRSRVLLEANDRIALRGDVRLRLGTHRGLREGMGVRIAGAPGVDERMVFLIAGVGQEIVPGADAAPAQIRTTLALQADDVPVAGAAPQETFAGRYRRLPPVEEEEEQTADAPDAVRWPALTAGSFVRVNSAGTALEMRTPAQVLADLLPAVTAGSFVRVNPGGTLEVRTSAQVLADLLPTVTAGSFVRVNPGGTLEVRTSAQVLADLLPALTAGSFLRVNSAGTGLEVRTSAQVLADLLPALTAESFLRVNSAGTGLEVRTSAQVLADLLPALTAGSFLRVNSAGTGLEVRTSAQVLADLLPALTAESFLRVNSAGTGLEVRTSAQVLADLLPTVTTTSILVVNSGGTLGVRALSGLLPALTTAGSYLRVNSGRTGLEMRTLAQLRADLLPLTTAGSYLRVNRGRTGLEPRTLAQLLADLLPTVTTTSILVVNSGGTLGVRALSGLLPALTAGSFLRVNSAGTGLEMRTLAQIRADLLPTVTTTSYLRVNRGGTLGVLTSAQALRDLLPRLTAGSYLRVNSGRTGLEMRTLAQLLADLLPTVATTSILVVNRGGTLGVRALSGLLPRLTTAGSYLRVNRGRTGLELRTPAEAHRDLLPRLTTAGSYLRVNSGRTGLEPRTPAQALRDLLPVVTKASYLRVNPGRTVATVQMRTLVEVLADLLAAGEPRLLPPITSGRRTVTAPTYACRWLAACWGAGGGGGASDGSRQAGSGGSTTLARGSVTLLVANGGAGGYAGEVNTPGATPGGGSGGVVIPGAGAAGGAGGRRFTESHGSTHSRHGHDGGAGGLAIKLFKPRAGARYTLTVGAAGAAGSGGGRGGSAGSRGAIAIIELR